MCDPITIAGAALTAISTGANAIAQNKVAAARNDALHAERIRQRGFDQEAAALNAHSQDQYQDFGGQQAQKSSSLADYFTQAQQTPEPTAAQALPASSSNLVVNEEAAQRADARASTDKSAAALGQLRSFGDVLGDLSRTQARDAGYIGQIGSFKKGSSAVLPYELDAASQKANGLKLFADITGGLGSIGTAYGISKGGLNGLSGLFGTAQTGATPITNAGMNSMATARALDRGSVAGYAGLSNLYGGR